jgi:hypothetical protein
MKIIGLAILGFLGYKAFNLGTTALTADNLNFKPSGFKYTGIKSGALNFNLYFDIVNPTQNSMKVNFIFADIFFTDGTLLTSINLPNYDKTITKAQVSTLEVPVKLFLTDVLFAVGPVWDAIKKGKMPNELQAKGNVRVNNMTFPFDEPIKLL